MTGDVNDVMPGSNEQRILEFEKKKNSWDSSLEEGRRFLELAEARPVGIYEMCHAFVEEIVSLSPHVEKP